MTPKHPVIGICPGYQSGKLRQLYLRAEYAEAIELAGGVPLVLATTELLGLIPDMLRRVDGVLLTGGPDLNPAAYGGDRHPATRIMEIRRQAFDEGILQEACRIYLPVLAICLGIQQVNVSRGGTLIQDLPSEGYGALHNSGTEDYAVHTVRVAPDTLLERIVGTGELRVNSSHHQAVRALGRGLVAVAHAEGELIEAVEDPSLSFFLGVQWHPERLTNDPSHLALFQAFVSAARCRISI
jgi:putative glutamine amidotransferase